MNVRRHVGQSAIALLFSIAMRAEPLIPPDLLVIQPDVKVQRLTAVLKLGSPGRLRNPRTNDVRAWFAFNPHRYTNDLLPAMKAGPDGTLETKGRHLAQVRGTWVLAAEWASPDAPDQTRFAKALLLSGLPTPEHEKELGQTLEFIPVSDPFSIGPNGTFTFKVHFQGKPLSDAPVRLISDTSPTPLDLKTDGNGTATITQSAAGNLLLFVEHMDRTKRYNATLYFPWTPPRPKPNQ